MRWVLLRDFAASKSSTPASANDNIFMKIVFRVITENIRSIIFGSTKHKAAIETTKCFVLKVKF